MSASINTGDTRVNYGRVWSGDSEEICLELGGHGIYHLSAHSDSDFLRICEKALRTNANDHCI